MPDARDGRFEATAIRRGGRLAAPDRRHDAYAMSETHSAAAPGMDDYIAKPTAGRLNRPCTPGRQASAVQRRVGEDNLQTLA